MKPKQTIVTSLFDVSGVAARIFKLPNRPPFMIAADLAEVYGTKVSALNQAVSRNPERFPEDFMFTLAEGEMEHLKSQNVISTKANRALPAGFTHAGAYALSAPESEAVVALMATTGADGKTYDMLCLAYEDLFPWLMGIAVSRVKPEAQEPLRRLRTEIKLVLAAHYHDRLLGESREAVTQLQAFLTDYVALRPIRARVQLAVANGWTWQVLVQNTSYTQKRLIETIRDLLRIGAIPHAPEGAPLDGGDPRQMSLFGNA